MGFGPVELVCTPRLECLLRCREARTHPQVVIFPAAKSQPNPPMRLNAYVLAADPTRTNRIFIGTGGRGVFVGAVGTTGTN